MFKTIAIFAIIAAVAFADPKADPKAKPGVLAYSAPVVAASYAVPSAAIVERSYHGNGFVYPYASAPYVAAAPLAYSAYTAPVLLR